jgi:DNA-binding Lrp family transcriptional regulator
MFKAIEKKLIRKLQEDIPLVSQPYKAIADELGITEYEVLEKVQEFCNNGVIRRLGASLNHRNIGVKANAMVVWYVPEQRIEEVSKVMVSFKEVSHCYQRPILQNWHYNIFTMIHGLSRQQCESVVNEIQGIIDIHEYDILYSTKELKKTSMKYFVED